MSGSQKLTGKTPFTVRFWPKADTHGRILSPQIGHPAFFGRLSVRYRPKADIKSFSLADRLRPQFGEISSNFGPSRASIWVEFGITLILVYG
jgi:hypothetical protein